jgi:hypothetical protein
MHLAAAVWLTATLAHFALAYRLARRCLPAADLDRLIWTWSVLAVGILSAVLHVLAATRGITLAGGVVGLAVAHGIGAWLTKRTPGTAPPRMEWAELAAVALAVALTVTSASEAVQSTAVEGTDAAHYHAPNAVNFALGGRLLDLPATPHLYPIAASLIGAWFIVPFGAPLVLELCMLLPLLLLASSLNQIFRMTTGLSGLAWTSWLTLLLLALPLFRFSSYFSADLWFAAAYVATVTVLLRVWTERRWSPIDTMAAGLTVGLLLGSKTTGTAAAALLVGTALLLVVSRFAKRGRPVIELQKAVSWIACVVVLGVCAGGIWLIRNWLLFGSPLAPNGLTVLGVEIFPGEPVSATTYLSVVGDMQADGYAVLPRTLRYAKVWLAPWFVWTLAPLLLLGVDLVVTWWLNRWSPLAGARATLLILVLLPGVGLLWLLAGAPWTSLEWTRGFSLRYALPLWTLIPLAAVVALFTISWPWYKDPAARIVGLVLTIALASALFFDATRGSGPRFVPLPRVTPAAAAAAAFVAAVAYLGRSRPRLRAGLFLLAAFVASSSWIATAVERLSEERAAAYTRLEDERRNPETAEPHRQPLLAAIDAETRSSRPCQRRRFLVLTRFDLPLALQDPRYSSFVHYVGRDVESARTAGRVSPCDYVIASEPYLDTEKGRTMVAVLSGGRPFQRIVVSRDFVLFAPGQD